MPSVTYDGQCFSIDHRPIWLLGATLHYARIPRELWADRIAAARQAGFNMIETICPWMHHEPRRGRYNFDGQADVAGFVDACHAAGMYVALRIGPFVGDAYDAGGLPPWLLELPDVSLRHGNEVLFERVGAYVRKLAGALSDRQASKNGPIVLVQCEHAWTCGNDLVAEKYLKEIARLVREAGFDVPLTNANDLWPDDPSTISTWRGWDDMLLHLRQLRTIQPNAPRLVSTFNPGTVDLWGQTETESKTPAQIQRHLAEVLSAGAQFIVNPFHAGTLLGFDGGRMPGGTDHYISTSPHAGALLGEAGHRGEAYRLTRRIVTFANAFGHVFSGLDPDYHPVVLAPDETVGSDRPSIVPLRGAQGRVTFIFAGSKTTKTTSLLLDDGLRMPVHLGGMPVCWTVFDVDLGGSGRLDYTNVCPFTMVGKTVVFFGTAKSTALLSINRTPLQSTVPAGKKPVVLEHHGLNIVICSHDQIDLTYDDGERVYVGVAGLTADGDPIAAPGYPKATVIHPDGTVSQQAIASETPASSRKPKSKTLTDWKASPADAHTDGTSPRYASLDGPASLQSCGAAYGYGWYRVEITSKATKKRVCHLPQTADRLHLFLDGEPLMVYGNGPAAVSGVFDLKLSKGSNMIVGLADNLGRFSDGNDLGEPKGWFGHLHEVKKLTAVRPKKMDADVVDPLQFKPFISGLATGQISEIRQAVWTFTHARKAPILLDVNAASVRGTFVLNDVPVAYYAGASGANQMRIVLQPSSEYFKRGKNILRFAPDPHQDGALERIAKATTLYECIDSLTQKATWSFAKWEPPANSKFKPVAKSAARTLRGTPCWWKTTFTIPATTFPAWLDTAGLSKGQAYLNGENLGRYFRSAGDGKTIRPQTRLYLPEPWLKPGDENTLLLFDEHGFDPTRAKIVFDESDGRS